MIERTVRRQNFRLDKLRSLGFQIALDDLGAGYAGLNSFATLQPTIVKLDMSLVSGIDLCNVRQRLVRSMVEACHDLSVRVVAEGIESREELDCCVSLGCDLLQGYLIAKPAGASTGIEPPLPGPGFAELDVTVPKRSSA